MAVSITSWYDYNNYSWYCKLTLNSVNVSKSGNTVTVKVGWAKSEGRINASSGPVNTWYGLKYTNGSASSTKHSFSGTSGTYTYTFTDTNNASHSGSFNYYAGVQGWSEYGTNEEEAKYTYTIPAAK